MAETIAESNTETAADNVLEVRMLGGFLLTFGGHELPLGRKNTAKFIQLLQMVWLSGEKGSIKEVLMNSLYERESASNLNNCFNNLLYQVNKQMAKSGLPEGSYIIRKDKRYMRGNAVVVRVDALEFAELARRAALAEGDGEKYRLYKQAFDLYEGELLPAIANETWVASASLRLQKMFDETAGWLGEYLKGRREYEEMYRVYAKAAAIYPFDEWQIDQIDSLLCRGEYKDAYLLYDRTVRLYSDEMGLLPSQRMLDCYLRMDQKMIACPDELSQIRAKLNEDPGEDRGAGAYYCSYPSFIDTYRLMVRSMERMGNSIFLMLCTLADYEGRLIKNREKLKKCSECLNEAIRCSLRRSDVYAKYSDSQYLILIVGTNQEDCRVIFRRINRRLRELAGFRAELSYNMSSLLERAEAKK